MSDRKRGQSRIVVRKSRHHDGYYVLDTHTGASGKLYPFKEQAERRARRERAKLGKSPTSGTNSADPKKRV